MSLGPTFVKAVDGNYYEDPLYQGDGWFLCFDEEDEPELVVSLEVKKDPNEILKDAGIKFSSIREGNESERIFGEALRDDHDFKATDLTPARSYWVTITDRPPVPTEYDKEYKVSKDTTVEGTYYDYGGKS